MNTKFFKLFKNYEYWPSHLFYIPLFPYALYLAAKSRSFGFFSAVNPAIEGSGNGLESKFKTIELLPKPFKPKTIFIKKNSDVEIVLYKIQQNSISYPLIVKPDIGFRGLLVKKITSEIALKNYFEKFNSINLIIQEFVDYPNECGIFYYKIPGEKTGKITSITLKQYSKVVGDGISTVLELVYKNKRAKHYISTIKELNTTILNKIPSKNEEIILNNIGNHCKGTQFINANYLINNNLNLLLDTISNQIPGWYFGRIDLKYVSFEKLIQQKEVKILEINGIISEPTNIYDTSKGSYFKALLAIKNHWKILYKIAVLNHKKYQIPYTNFNYLITLYIKFKKYTKLIKKLSSA